MSLEIRWFPCLKDNYGFLAHDSESGDTASIDAPDGAAVIAAADAAGWAITDLLITHHHFDHTQGIAGVKSRFPKAKVWGPAAEAEKIGLLDVKLAEGDFARVGGCEAKVLSTPGHTAGHIVYWFEEQDVLFSGDALFALGCGRVFETPLETMWRSLVKLADLPGETQVYFAHEYTLANARFALTIEPENAFLRARVAEAEIMRAEGRSTSPTTIAAELLSNPFLRAARPELQAAIGLTNADPAEVFAEIRRRKDRF